MQVGVEHVTWCLQIWYGQLVLQQAETSSSESVGSSLLLAHKVLTQVVSISCGVGGAEKALACMLLAKVEVRGNLRRKHERAEAHAMQVKPYKIFQTDQLTIVPQKLAASRSCV